MNYTITPLKGGLNNIKGIFCDGFNAGFKPKDNDVGFIYSQNLLEVEALFTTTAFKAAPLKHFLEYPKNFKTNFLLLNSKNANAMTGKEGLDDVKHLLDYATKTLAPHHITNPIMSSTGVIGSRLDLDKIKGAIDHFDCNAQHSQACAEAIMTTDTTQKEIAFEVVCGEGTFNISAIAKGAGMIHPAMGNASLATMLCFIVTDANVPKEDMRDLLTEHNETTFNAISVDGETSTNDTVMLLSTQQSGVYDKEAFSFALHKVMQQLAIEILADGEGSSKVVAFRVSGAKNDAEAKIVAKALSQSLLIKTALFGQDPNWGRIASSIGASGCACDEERLSIAYDGVQVFQRGQNLFSNEVEEQASKVMSKDSFSIICDLGIGDGSFVAFGCDLGYEYVKINADYRT